VGLLRNLLTLRDGSRGTLVPTAVQHDLAVPDASMTEWAASAAGQLADPPLARPPRSLTTSVAPTVRAQVCGRGDGEP